jgi:hypothetical protein
MEDLKHLDIAEIFQNHREEVVQFISQLMDVIEGWIFCGLAHTLASPAEQLSKKFVINLGMTLYAK